MAKIAPSCLLDGTILGLSKAELGIWIKVSAALSLLHTSDKLLQDDLEACLRFF
jgi:hypothetical protein